MTDITYCGQLVHIVNQGITYAVANMHSSNLQTMIMLMVIQMLQVYNTIRPTLIMPLRFIEHLLDANASFHNDVTYTELNLNKSLQVNDRKEVIFQVFLS